MLPGRGLPDGANTIRTITHTSLYTLTLAGIYCYNGCLSGTWWSATAKIGTEHTHSTVIPWYNDRMSSRSFIFRKFLCGIHKYLWPEKLWYTDTHRTRTLLSATTSNLYSDWKCAFGAINTTMPTLSNALQKSRYRIDELWGTTFRLWQCHYVGINGVVQICV